MRRRGRHWLVLNPSTKEHKPKETLISQNILHVSWLNSVTFNQLTRLHLFYKPRFSTPSASIEILKPFFTPNHPDDYKTENKPESYHIRTSGLLTHLQGNQVSLLQTDAAIDQQERPHEAERRHVRRVLYLVNTRFAPGRHGRSPSERQEHKRWVTFKLTANLDVSPETWWTSI